MTIHPFVERVFGTNKKDEKPLFKFSISIPFVTPKGEKTDIEATTSEMICYIIGAVLAIWYAISKNWLANDILGVCFCIQAIEMMSLGTFVNGLILLSGLFLYDIF